MIRARRRPATPDTQAASSAGTEAPRWASEASSSASNSEILAMVADAQVEEAQACMLLEGEHGLEALEGEDLFADMDASEQTSSQGSAPPVRRPAGRLGGVFDDHQRHTGRMQMTLSRTQRAELAMFRSHWETHRGRYEAVAAQTDVPAILIAAIHYRESSLDFGTYLHQGDPLGKPAVNHPANIPVFHVWEDAAVHALNSKGNIRDSLNMTAETTDRSALATYAEAYNGLGYHYRDLESPYVYAGTDRYTGGRFVADGKFDPTSFDRRLGVLTIVEQMEGEGLTSGPFEQRDPWDQVVAGDRVLRMGRRGAAVEALQQRLADLGYTLDVDGAFGPATKAVVEAFQQENGLVVDGVVGVKTAAAFEVACGPSEQRSPQETAWEAVVAGDTILRRGDDGPAVEALQERLRAFGLGLAVDGAFGPVTRAAVYEVQSRLGITVDGTVGPETAAALDGAVGR